MMSLPITNTGGATDSIAAATRGAVGQSQLNTDHFLQLLVTQLQNQDPLEPMSNENFLTQLAQFQSLQEQIETSANTKNLLLAQSLGAASALVGKEITAVQDGYEISGLVDKVVVVDGQVKLVVDGVEIGLGEVKEVRGEVG